MHLVNSIRGYHIYVIYMKAKAIIFSYIFYNFIRKPGSDDEWHLPGINVLLPLHSQHQRLLAYTLQAKQVELDRPSLINLLILELFCF